MTLFADLHLHSYCSDGSDSPWRVVERAEAAGIAAMSLTDHDTVAGIAEASSAAVARNIAFLSGVEISSWFEGREVHIVGLGIDPASPPLLEALARQRDARAGRVATILEKLAAIGIEIALDAAHDSTSLGRMHIARAMRDAGRVRRTQEAFDRYLNAGRPAHVPKPMMPASEAISLIHLAGGLAFVAHPGLSRSLTKLLPRLLELPFDGIEAWHISHSPGQIAEFQALAANRALLVSGGSDCHGTMKAGEEMGKVRVPLQVFDRLQAAISGSRS